MRRARVLLSVLPLLALPAAASAQPSGMKATAPEKMLPPGEAGKMRACNDKAMQQKIPMAQKAAFVNKCMAAMK